MRGRLGGLILAAALLCVVAGSSVAHGAPAKKSTTFTVVRSAGALAAGCLAQAKATATIVSSGTTETMTIAAQGLPPHATFDVFVLQIPNAPFGVSSYVGAMKSGNQGKATVEVVGRFGLGTFTIAPGSAAAPAVDASDATTNPAFAPVHQLHLGIWFDSPDAGAAAGCANVVTPFNATHSAGPQALSTRNFADGSGPLGRIH
jgi:hypothetical protein